MMESGLSACAASSCCAGDVKVIGLPLRVRTRAALIKGATLALMGLWVLGSTVWHALVLGSPHAGVMRLIASLALATNLASVLILLRYKDGDANVRSVWLCTRNDAVGNMVIMASLFINSASKILRQALGEWRPTQRMSTSDQCYGNLRTARRM